MLTCVAVLILAATATATWRLFPGDRFAQAVLWAIALPVTAYLLHVGHLAS